MSSACVKCCRSLLITRFFKVRPVEAGKHLKHAKNWSLEPKETTSALLKDLIMIQVEYRYFFHVPGTILLLLLLPCMIDSLCSCRDGGSQKQFSDKMEFKNHVEVLKKLRKVPKIRSSTPLNIHHQPETVRTGWRVSYFQFVHVAVNRDSWDQAMIFQPPIDLVPS